MADKDLHKIYIKKHATMLLLRIKFFWWQ